MTTHSLVLETHNLEGGTATATSAAASARGTEQLVASLELVLGRLAEQTYELDALADVVVTHRGLDAASRARCDRAAGVAIRWLELDDEAGYYEAKNRGFDVARGDVVVFADADCWPEPDWLEQLVKPFADPAVRAVAGRTTYRKDLLGTAASTIDFMYFPSPRGPQFTRNFYANNIAFRRDVFDTRRYGDHAMYRGHCAVLGLDLHLDGIPILFVPAARTIHKFPDSTTELIKLRLMRGRDTYELTPHLTKKVLDAKVPRLGPITPLAILATRFAFSLRSINRQDMPESRGLRRVACAGAIAAISAVDAIGAIAGGLGLMKAAPHAALSYHGNADGLDAAA